MKPGKLLIILSAILGVGLVLPACQPENQTELADAEDNVADSGAGTATAVTEPKLAGVPEPSGLIELRDGIPIASAAGYASLSLDEATGFASDAFPPTISDTKWHGNAWEVNDCLRCHETGVGNAPRVVHQSMPDILLKAQCRTCHVIEPNKTGDLQRSVGPADGFYDRNAFPPMLPNSRSHLDAWLIEDCLMCHQDGTADAPRVEHVGLPRILLKAKCRSCHVQVRSIEGDSPVRN